MKKLKSAENTIEDEVIILLYHFSNNLIITHDNFLFYFNCELLGEITRKLKIKDVFYCLCKFRQ